MPHNANRGKWRLTGIAIDGAPCTKQFTQWNRCYTEFTAMRDCGLYLAVTVVDVDDMDYITVREFWQSPARCFRLPQPQMKG